MKKRREERSNKIKLIIILISILVVVLVIVGVIFYIRYTDKKLINSIKGHYYKNVVVTKKCSIYNKNKKSIGKIEKNFNLVLDDIKITKSSQQYFKIKDTDFYVYYEDVKKNNKKSNDVVDSKYLMFNKNIVSKNQTFYKEGREVLKINKNTSLPIQYMDNEYYYVYYLDNLLQIKKSDEDVLVDNDNTLDVESDYISVINYGEIGECSRDTCVSVDNVVQQLNYLKSEGFYSISLLEYKNWLEGNIRLRQKAILLTTNTNNDNINNINNESDLALVLLDNTDLKFSAVNKKSTKDSVFNDIEMYLVKKNTTLDNFKKMSLGEDVIEVEVKITPSSGEQRIAVLNYHFFYDPNLGESCNEAICLEVSKFREQLDYLKNNGYKTLKMEEFRKWMYGEIELPEKSVLITVDDGAMGTGSHNGNKLIPILEEYNMNATLFLISGWWDVNNYRSKNLDIQSHTQDMHQYGSCGKGQLVCASKEEAMADLRTSLTIVDNNNSFCYPFYSYSDVAIEAVKEVGFKMAFAGGSVKARRSNNKYIIPRYPIYKSTTMDQFIKMVS